MYLKQLVQTYTKIYCMKQTYKGEYTNLLNPERDIHETPYT